MVVIFRRRDAVVDHIQQAAAKHAEAVWLPPGTWSREAEDAARTHNLTLIKDRCIIEEHQHLAGARGEATAGHPRKQRVHVRRRLEEIKPVLRSADTLKAGAVVTRAAEESTPCSTKRR